MLGDCLTKRLGVAFSVYVWNALIYSLELSGKTFYCTPKARRLWVPYSATYLEQMCSAGCRKLIMHKINSGSPDFCPRHIIPIPPRSDSQVLAHWKLIPGRWIMHCLGVFSLSFLAADLFGLIEFFLWMHCRLCSTFVSLSYFLEAVVQSVFSPLWYFLKRKKRKKKNCNAECNSHPRHHQ